MLTLLIALWVFASFPLGILTGRVIRNANARQDAADERGEGLGGISNHFGNLK